MSETAPRHTGPAPSVGRIVHYKLPNGRIRPAIITEVWPGNSRVNLTVFMDGSNDGVALNEFPGLGWVPSAAQAGQGEEPQPGQWFWPPKVPE